jgi:hypothetical protein
MANTFKVGDIIVHKSSFLRSVGWYIDVPINGKVLEVEEPDKHGWQMVTVQWNDRESPIRVNAGNLILESEKHLEPA